MKNTKPNRDITAEVLKEFNKKYPARTCPFYMADEYGNWSMRASLRNFIKRALRQQRESLDAEWKKRCLDMLEELRMERKDFVIVMNKQGREFLSPSDWEKRGFNIAVDESNSKLAEQRTRLQERMEK